MWVWKTLAPELARGFEIAYEHYLSEGGIIGANYFYRRINDLIRKVSLRPEQSYGRLVSRHRQVGADDKFRSLPISMGASVNYTPAYDLQLSDMQSNSVSAKAVTDAFAVWFTNPNAQMRFSANPSKVRWVCV